MITNEAKIDACARAAYEANRAYGIAIGEVSEAHPHWEDAPAWQKQSTRNGVAGALAGNTPEASHESWFAEKWADGWKYGPVKSAEKREHPCMRPYSDLPPEQRAKDALYLAIVRAVDLAIMTATTEGSVVAIEGDASMTEGDTAVIRKNPHA